MLKGILRVLRTGAFFAPRLEPATRQQRAKYCCPAKLLSTSRVSSLGGFLPKTSGLEPVRFFRGINEAVVRHPFISD